MTRLRFKHRFASFLTLGLLAILFAFSTLTVVRAQALCAAASGSLIDGPFVTVNSDQAFVNVRNGPNSYLYDKVGILYPGESAPALGRSPGGDWIQIGCPGAPGGLGWVYSANVTLTSTGFLPVVEPPASPTPPAPPTVDQTLAAAFNAQPTPTRLPTYTPPAPVSVPTFTDVDRTRSNADWIAPLIGGFALLGVLGFSISFFFKR